LTLILEKKFSGSKCAFQTLADPLFPAAAQGSSLLNGLTMTLLYTPASM
jgi:hypothetical protein